MAVESGKLRKFEQMVLVEAIKLADSFHESGADELETFMYAKQLVESAECAVLCILDDAAPDGVSFLPFKGPAHYKRQLKAGKILVPTASLLTADPETAIDLAASMVATRH